MAKDLFKRYIWLIDTIYRSKKITLKEINDKWQRADSENEPIPNRTFHNHRAAIEDFFDIVILCDKAQNAYYIEDAGQLANSTAKNWLLNTLSASNLVSESRKLKNRILFDNIPSGQQYLTTMIEAMREGVSLWVSYQSFWRDEPSEFEIQPYALKIFKQRWYVLANSAYENKLRIYALDRLLSASLTEKRFELPDDFDAEAYFANSFGIIVDESIEPCTVVIRAFGNKSKYFRTLPLHRSQQEIATTADYSVFSYFVSPTYDFVQEILSHGYEIEILSPDWLRKDVFDIAWQTEDSYTNGFYTEYYGYDGEEEDAEFIENLISGIK